MGKIKRKKCRNCGCLFVPDYRNRDRQNYCDKPECKEASKKASQKKWLSKPENKDHFRGIENVIRVQEWRKQNPGYWKRTKSKRALQETCFSQVAENTDDNTKNANNALQDLLIQQSPVIIGLISNFIGSALQDDIAQTLLRMQQSGNDILYRQPINQGGSNDCKNPDFKNTSTKSSQKLQLDRSPTGQK